MKTTKHLSVAAVLTVLMQMGCQSHTDNTRQTLHLPELNEVRIEDAFWSPTLDIWRKITTNDVLNKFEGKYTPFPGSTDTRNAFRNFDRVAEGQRDIKQHDGPEWYDGLVYESIRGIADFLASHPNHVYTKEELFREIWDMESVGDIATVTVHIKKIREKIEFNTAKPQYIETIWGVGYRFKV